MLLLSELISSNDRLNKWGFEIYTVKVKIGDLPL